MTEFETLWRDASIRGGGALPPEPDGGVLPRMMFLSGTDDGGVDPLEAELADIEDDVETEEEVADRTADEARTAEIQRLASEEVKRILAENADEMRQEARKRLESQRDPVGTREARITEIAEMHDEIERTKATIELAKEELRAEFQEPLAHSQSQGAYSALSTTKILTSDGVPVTDARLRPYIDQVLNQSNITPEKARDPGYAQQVYDMAYGAAARSGALKQAETPAARANVLRPAPAGGNGQRQSALKGYPPGTTADRKAIIDRNMREVVGDNKDGKSPIDIFEPADFAMMFADAGVR